MQDKCLYKVGLLNLRDCQMDAVGKCITCSRPVCTNHGRNTESGERVRCLECHVEWLTQSKAGKKKGEIKGEEENFTKMRKEIYKQSGYETPFYFGDSGKYGDEDYRAFEKGAYAKLDLLPEEVALLMKKPHKAIAVIVMSLANRGYIDIINRYPLQVKINKKTGPDLVIWETTFLVSIRPDGTLEKNKIEEILEPLVKSLEGKLSDADAARTERRYTSRVNTCWDEFNSRTDYSGRRDYFDQYYMWMMLNDSYRSMPGDFMESYASDSSASGAPFFSGISGQGGSVIDGITGFADGIASTVENAASGIVGSVESFFSSGKSPGEDTDSEFDSDEFQDS